MSSIIDDVGFINKRMKEIKSNSGTRKFGSWFTRDGDGFRWFDRIIDPPPKDGTRFRAVRVDFTTGHYKEGWNWHRWDDSKKSFYKISAALLNDDFDAWQPET